MASGNFQLRPSTRWCHQLHFHEFQANVIQVYIDLGSCFNNMLVGGGGG